MDDKLIYDKLDLGAREILARMNAANYECYLVGGSLRDLLLDKPVHDYDFTSNAHPKAVEAVFANEQVIETGIKHGTVTVLLHGQTYEITTFRKDTTYSDHRHPDGIIFAETLTEDLARRDFTINALAWSPKSGLVDLYAGLQDLHKRLIKAVNEPKERMQEDALRILRALRFSSTLQFNIAAETKQAILDLMPTLSYVARERILQELDKLFLGKWAFKVLAEYSTAFQAAYPDFWAKSSFKLTSCLDLWQQIEEHKEQLAQALQDLASLRSISNLPLLENYFVGEAFNCLATVDKAVCNSLYLTFCWAACLEPHLTDFKLQNNLLNGKQVGKKLASTFLWSNQRRDLLLLCTDTLSPSFLQKNLLSTPTANWARLICSYSCEALALSLLYALISGRLPWSLWYDFLNFMRQERCFTLRDLNMRGDTLISLRKDIPKPAISQYLKRIWLAVLEGKVKNEASELADYLLKMPIEKE